MRDSEIETSGLLAGVRLAGKKLQTKTFRGNSKEKTVSVKINGSHQPEEVEINAKAFGISKEQAKEISSATKEALDRAISNAQKSAARTLEEELKQN